MESELHARPLLIEEIAPQSDTAAQEYGVGGGGDKELAVAAELHAAEEGEDGREGEGEARRKRPSCFTSS